jgi:translocator protein
MSILAMILFPLCVTLPGMINGILTANNIKTWYEKLNHPKIRPPNWVFGPVWTILYIMIGVSGYLIWSLDEGFSGKYSFAWTIYFIQLLLNHIWTPLFFGIHALFLALIDIVLMLIAIYINIFAFYAMGIGDWGLGIGPNPQSPIPNPQSPIPNLNLPTKTKISLYLNINKY